MENQGTIEQAKINASRWLQLMPIAGAFHVELLPCIKEVNGRWLFTFRHQFTNNTATLETHGFTENECKLSSLGDEMYWNGCATSVPSVDDWFPESMSSKPKILQPT